MTQSQLNEQEAIWMPNQADKTLFDLYYLNGKKLPFKARKDSWKEGEYIEVVQMRNIMSKQAVVLAIYSASPHKEPLKRNDAEKPIWRIVDKITGETIIEII